MKKLFAFVLTAIIILALDGCNQNNSAGKKTSENSSVESQTETTESLESEETPSDRIPMVRVNGTLYLDTGKESTLAGRCGTNDGEITSTVDANQIPMEENQSNFGIGYGYQLGQDGTIEVLIDEKRIVFEVED